MSKVTTLEPKGFTEFWSAYPNKKAKGEARKAWKQVNGPERLETILAALPQYKAYVERTPWLSYAHPATWLRAERWEDEYEVPQAQLFGSNVSRLMGQQGRLQ